MDEGKPRGARWHEEGKQLEDEPREQRVCEQCGHRWALHLLGELLVGCTEPDCHCRREPGDYAGDGCAACGGPVWTSPLQTPDVVCDQHRREVQEVMRQRFLVLIANAPNAPNARPRRRR
jgi:DNA-directed RNA polymerase subunit RPC12/RpoP